mgnify:CR=1 FL=1
MKDRYGYGTEYRINPNNIQSNIDVNFDARRVDGPIPKGIKPKALNNSIIELDPQNALEQAKYLKDYVFAGSNAIQNLKFSINNELYDYNIGLFSGPSLNKVEYNS